MELSLVSVIVIAVIASIGLGIYKTIKGLWNGIDSLALKPKLFCPKCKMYFPNIEHHICHLQNES